MQVNIWERIWDKQVITIIAFCDIDLKGLEICYGIIFFKCLHVKERQWAHRCFVEIGKTELWALDYFQFLFLGLLFNATFLNHFFTLYTANLFHKNIIYAHVCSDFFYYLCKFCFCFLIFLIDAQQPPIENLLLDMFPA